MITISVTEALTMDSYTLVYRAPCADSHLMSYNVKFSYIADYGRTM